MFIRREGEELNDLLFYALSSAKMLVLQLHHLNNYLFNIGDIAIGTGQGQDVPYSIFLRAVQGLSCITFSEQYNVVHTVSFKNQYRVLFADVSCNVYHIIHLKNQYWKFHIVHFQKQYSGSIQYNLYTVHFFVVQCVQQCSFIEAVQWLHAVHVSLKQHGGILVKVKVK